MARMAGLAVCDPAWLQSGGASGRLIQYVNVVAQRKRLKLHLSKQFVEKNPLMVDVLKH